MSAGPSRLAAQDNVELATDSGRADESERDDLMSIDST
jgi:hypothetical protein